MEENNICEDNRFEIIEKAKKILVNATNIELSKKEIKVLTNILFRMWQVCLINEEKLEINKSQKENSIEETIKIIEEMIKSYKEADRCGLSNNDFKNEIKALSNILLDYKRVLKENEELNKNYNSLIDKIILKIDEYDYEFEKAKKQNKNDIADYYWDLIRNFKKLLGGA